MKKTNNSSKDLQNVNAAPLAESQNLETINAATIPAPEENNNSVTPEITGKTDFPHVDNFPTLTEGAKFEVNGYKVSITGREYLKEEKYPFTAWTAQVTTPDGTTKDFTKVRNTAICNFCHASTGIIHDGNNGGSIKKILSDEELATETTRRANQIAGLLTRAAELCEKYTNGRQTTAATADDIRNAIFATLEEENNRRKADKEQNDKRNAEREQKKRTKSLQQSISELIAAGKFAEAQELISKAQNAHETQE